MHLLRRGVALLMSLLLAHVIVAGAAAACAMHGGQRTEASAHGVLHAAAEMTEAAESGSCDAPGAPSEPAAPTSHSGCHLPWAPGSCASMTSCAASMVLVPRVALGTLAPVAPLAAESVSTPLGPATPPDLPPPRA